MSHKNIFLYSFCSLFLRLVMGKVNVRVWNKGDQLKLRSEYAKFKKRTTMIFTLFPFVQLMFGWTPFLWQYVISYHKTAHKKHIISTTVNHIYVVFRAHQLWLVYYYCSLALRENVLAVNGSNIRQWWIQV